MAYASEITVIAKDEEKTLKVKHLVYDTYSVDPNDPIIKNCVNSIRNEFSGEPSNITVKISMEI